MAVDYSDKFYTERERRAILSAERVVPVILSYLQPKSVIDVGCGSGSWCSAFAKNGVPEVLGLDGPWASEHNKDAPFVPFDFATAPLPFQPPLKHENYDLAFSVEFAEHVANGRADAIVDFLTSLAPVVVFSAAIPGQGGTGHINEQWPDYWVRKFAARDYEACDFLRPLIWNDDQVQSWYRQNVVVYFKGGTPEQLKQRLAREALERLRTPMPLVHPVIFHSKLAQRTLRRGARVFLGRLRRAVLPS